MRVGAGLYENENEKKQHISVREKNVFERKNEGKAVGHVTDNYLPCTWRYSGAKKSQFGVFIPT